MGNHGNAMLGGHVGAQLGVLFAAKSHMPVLQTGQPQDGVDHSGLAHPVAPNECHTLARVHMQVQTVQDVRGTVVGVDVFQIQ